MKGLLISARQLLRAPAFLTLATLALALGIGSTTTIFSIVRAVFLRALPYSEPATLMQLTSSVKEQQIENAGFSYPRYEAVRDRQTAFSAMSYAIGTAFTLTGTTGARDEISPALAGLVERTRGIADGVPLYAGFGIATPEQASAVAALTDGVVVGSRAVQIAEDGPRALGEYVASLRAAIYA